MFSKILSFAVIGMSIALSGLSPVMAGTNPNSIQGFGVNGPNNSNNSDGTSPASGVTVASPAHLLTQIPQAGQMIGKSVNVNGGSEISQINGTTLITPTNGSYPIDNVMLTTSVAGVFQSVQVNSTNVGTYTTGYLGSLGATNALRWSVLATNGAPAAGAKFASYYPIEGLNFARFQYGTANAKAGSLQFKVRCSVSGTYSGAIKNYANTRAYPFSYSCTAGTDTQVYVQNIPGDTGGTWVGNTNAGAAYITFDLGSGSNFKTTANAWATGDYNGVTGATNLSAQANGTTLTITDVQFEVGSFCTQYERKLYDQVLRECQRYYRNFLASGTNFGGTAYGASTVLSPPMMNASPTITLVGGYCENIGVLTPVYVFTNFISAEYIMIQFTAASATIGYSAALTGNLATRI